MTPSVFFNKIAEPKIRVRILYTITLVAGVIVLALPPGIFIDLEAMEQDKALHFEGGNIIATGSFVLLYALLSTYLLLFNQNTVTLRLLYLPTAFALAGGTAMAIVFFVAGGKEVIDATGAGTVDWYDFTATIDGAYLPNIEALLILLAITPALIPLDMLLQWPAHAGSSKSTGHSDVDTYLKEKKHLKTRGGEVLVVEDDLACANLAIKFCKKIGMKCVHKDSISAAEKVFQEDQDEIQLILLDLFVRVETKCDTRTGAEWLDELSKKHPKESRSFKVIITTGHPEQLGERAELADKVLAKPWSPADLKSFLIENSVIDP